MKIRMMILGLFLITFFFHGQKGLCQETTANTTTTLLSVSGYVRDQNGVPMAGVTIQFTGQGTATTNASGFYSKSGLPLFWSGRVTPVRSYYVFSPPFRDISLAFSSVDNVNFKGYYQPKVSGWVSKTDGTGVPGVTLYFSGGTKGDVPDPQTDFSGYYSQRVPYGFDGSLSPGKPGWTFGPWAGILFTVAPIITDRTIDWTAYPPGNVDITGTVLKEDGTPLVGAQISTDTGESTTSALDGTYTLTVPYDWSGTVTPDHEAYNFQPPNRTYSNVTSNQTNQDYTAILKTFIISGTVSTAEWVGVEGVLMSKSTGGSTTTGQYGGYTLTVPWDWSGTVTPSKAGYRFEPTYLTYANVREDQTDHGYKAYPTGGGGGGDITQTINFNSGWNMFSINVIPTDLNMATLMDAVKTLLVIVKNGAGQNYIPEFGINTIGNIDYLQGYQAYFKQAVDLEVTGQQANPATPIPLPSGWSMIAYLPSTAMNAATALASINNQLVIAKNNAGQNYIPEFGINTIGNMQAGQGYQVYLNGAGPLTYPAGMLAKDRDPHVTPLRDHFTFTANTGENATLILPTTANPRYSDGTGLASGDEIGVFNTAGLCCGAVVWEGQNTAITMWGDNCQTTETDGFTAGDTYHFRVWTKRDNKEYLASAQYQPEHPTTYGASNYTILTDLTVELNKKGDADENGMLPSEFKLYANHPNPFNSETVIRFGLSEQTRVILGIYNLMGQEIVRLVDGVYAPGLHKSHWDGRNALGEPVVSGVYLYRIDAGKYHDARKLILSR